MVDAWPVSLPQDLVVDGYQLAVGDPRLRSQPDAGPALVRARTSAVVDRLQGRMPMTTAQWAALMTFGKVTLAGWSLPFTFPDPDSVTDDLLVRFSEGMPTRAYAAEDLWNVTLDLEVLP